MNHRPYPDPDRALRQLARSRPTPRTFSSLLSHIGLELTPFQRAWLDDSFTAHRSSTAAARRTGRSAITAAIVDEATAAGEHVHVASPDGMRCAAGDLSCPLPRTEREDQDAVERDGRHSRGEVTDTPARDHPDSPPPALSATGRPKMKAARSAGISTAGAAANTVAFGRARAQAGVAAESERARALATGRCPDCGHAPHAAGFACEAIVDHGPQHWHRCLCLYQPSSPSPCHPLMTCHGGTLGYSDIWHLQRGHSLSSKDGPVTPDILAAPTGTTDQEPITLARVVRTCAAVPSQWNAWTTSGQYLYLRYRSGIGTVDAYDCEDPNTWIRIPDGAVARFDTGDRLDGEMTLVEFCERTDLELADAEVTGE